MLCSVSNSPGPDPFLPHSLMILPVFREFHHACVRVPAMAVGNEDVAVGRNHHTARSIEGIGSGARDAGLSERHQDFSVRTEFENLLPLAVLCLLRR